MLLTIDNFRGIEHQEVKLAPITVVYGANSAGKSSLLYALLTLKAAVLSSNAPVSSFFQYGFVSLGGFEAVVFDHSPRNKIGIALEVTSDAGQFQHAVELGESQGTFRFKGQYQSLKFDIEAPASFPYAGNQTVTVQNVIDEQQFAFTWNGITAQLPPGQQVSPALAETINHVVGLVNSPAEMLRRVTIVPLRRGFSKPVYQTQSLTAALITEDEVATYLASNKYLESRISHYLEDVLNEDFRVHAQLGTAIFSLDATDKNTGVATELVNEGFGVNQMVYFLAKALNPDALLTCIEEPEIHLHPAAVRRFARSIAKLMREERKLFVVSTHSEAFVLALLTLVAEKKLNPEEVAFYLAKKEGKRIKYHRQTIRDDGQIEGGLTSFMGGEMEDLKILLGNSNVVP